MRAWARHIESTACPWHPLAPPGWYRAAGHAYNCSAAASAAQQGGTAPAIGLGGGGRCDAGALGLLDLLLAADAARFVAIDVRTPWPSAYLEWIVQLRRQAGRESTLLRCGEA